MSVPAAASAADQAGGLSSPPNGSPPTQAARAQELDHPLVNKHITEINRLREQTFQLLDRRFQLETLRDATLEHARVYYKDQPEAIRTIESALGYIFANPDQPSFIFNAPRRIAQLLTHVPCVFTFLPGAGAHESLSQYDISAQGRYTRVTSRSQVNLATTLAPGFDLPGGPFMASPMRAVVGPRLIEAMIEEGLKPIMHRFREPTNPLDVDGETPSVLSKEETRAQQVALVRRYGSNLMVSCGVSQQSVDFAKQLLALGAGGVCIDTAIGNGVLSVAATLELRQERERLGSRAIIMPGNVDTDEGYLMNTLAGGDVARIGIGPGSPCTTRIVTRSGAGQGSALMGISRAAFVLGHRSRAASIVADGGMSNSADVLGALELGAHAAMMGRYFARCEESGGLKKEIDGKRCVFYYGEASLPARLQEEGRVKAGTTVEGDGKWLTVTGSFNEAVEALRAGLRNALPYYNARSPQELGAKVSIPQQLCDLILGHSTGINKSSPSHGIESGTQLK